MDCMLKIIAGPEAGQDFACGGPETYVGRSQRCAVRLSGTSASFEHALITRAGDDFFIENLSANGTVLNNERLGVKTRLRVRDQIRIGGDTVIRVESLPTSAATGSSRRLLLAAVVGMAILAVTFLLSDPFSSGGKGDWAAVYRAMQGYAQEQVATNHMPPDVPSLMSEAWRLETGGDRATAKKSWMRVHVQLNEWDRQQGWEAKTTSVQGLQALLTGKTKTLEPEEMRVALKQFVTQMERRK
jgi:pSer/pThr/pTyr-binding forkhead associated (FHA) protein